jgi:hypothetical protein
MGSPATMPQQFDENVMPGGARTVVRSSSNAYCPASQIAGPLGAMFRRYDRRMRWRAAIGLAALYAFCVLLPSMALAATQVAAHCLTGSNGASHVHRTAEKAPSGHSHASDAQHDHGHDGAPHPHEKTDDKAASGNCCGLFCVSAITHDGAFAPAVVFAAAKDSPAPAGALIGREPDRITRPPIR